MVTKEKRFFNVFNLKKIYKWAKLSELNKENLINQANFD